MSKKVEEKPEIRAQNFVLNAKEEFKKHIPRDAISDVCVSGCVEKDGAFLITGSVGTLSPTEKQKTFKYSATVKVDADGSCSISKMQVSEL